jgi:NADH-quinone oxidoreductase subunit L
VLAGALYVGDMAFGDFFGSAIVVAPQHDVLGALGADFHGAWGMVLHGFLTWPFWLAAGGVFTAWFLYMKRPELPGRIRERLQPLYNILDRKYGADEFNDWFFAGGSRALGGGLWRFGDVAVIDGMVVNGSARAIGWLAGVVRHLQSGYLYHYAFAMIVGLLLLFGLFVLGLAG